MEGFYPVCEHRLSSGAGISVHDALHNGLVDNALGHRETLVSQGCIFALNSLRTFFTAFLHRVVQKRLYSLFFSLVFILFSADFLLGMNLTSSRENHDILA